MTLNEKWRKRFNRWFRLRFAVLYPLSFWAIFYGFLDDESLRRGIGFILLGLAIRSWANCYAIKMSKLTTSGPYAFTRHPLYSGSFLIFLGALIALNISSLVIITLLFLFIGVIYRRTIRNEERMLLAKFGNAYADYQKKTPALLFSFVPYKEGEKWPASSKRYFQSQEYKLVIWTFITVILFHLKEEFLVEHENIDFKLGTLIGCAILLACLDITGEWIRKKEKKKKIISLTLLNEHKQRLVS